jgi:hypothetical protein
MKEMIERYVYAVTRRLPETIQEEVKEELKANIYDMLPENPNDTDIEKVLLELGHPRDMALKYQPVERYLISPRYFSDYLYTLKLVVIIFILVGFAFGLMDAFIHHTSTGLLEFVNQVFSTIFESIFDGIVSAFVIVTLVFVIIEYSQKNKPQVWNISKLPELPKKGEIKISRTKTVIDIVFFVSFSMILILVLSYYHRFIGLYVEDALVVKFFNPDTIKLFVPLFIIILIIGLISKIIKLVDGQWTKRTIIAHMVFTLLNLSLVIVFLSMPSLIINDFYIELSKLIEVSPTEVIDGFRIGTRSLIAVFTIITVAELSVLWYKILKNRSASLS